MELSFLCCYICMLHQLVTVQKLSYHKRHCSCHKILHRRKHWHSAHHKCSQVGLVTQFRVGGMASVAVFGIILYVSPIISLKTGGTTHFWNICQLRIYQTPKNISKEWIKRRNNFWRIYARNVRMSHIHGDMRCLTATRTNGLCSTLKTRQTKHWQNIMLIN